MTGLSDTNGHPVTVYDVVVTDDGAGNAVLTFPGGESLTLIGIFRGAPRSDLAYLDAMGIPIAGRHDRGHRERRYHPIPAIPAIPMATWSTTAMRCCPGPGRMTT